MALIILKNEWKRGRPRIFVSRTADYYRVFLNDYAVQLLHLEDCVGVLFAKDDNSTLYIKGVEQATTGMYRIGRQSRNVRNVLGATNLILNNGLKIDAPSYELSPSPAGEGFYKINGLKCYGNKNF